MTHDEMLDIDTRVCRGLGKRPGERLISAASRALRASPEASTRRAAALVLGQSGDVWERMRRAAEALAGVT